MTIGFDARLMSVPGGIPRYCRELLINLTEVSPETQFVVIVKKIPDDFPDRTNIRWIESSIHWYGWREQINLGQLMNSQTDVDLWHIPHWNVPLTLRRPFVMTFHDFIFEDFPTHDGSLRGKLKYAARLMVWRALISATLRRARAIITVSNYVKQRLIDRFPHVAQKTTTIYCGLTQLPPAQAQETAITTPYFLVVGNSYPHKNHGLIFKTILEQPKLGAHWYIVTHRDRFSEAHAQEVVTLGLAHRVHFLFDASDATLAWLYEHATALVLPSFAEGFGIPPLEALSFGKPAIVAKTTSLPEVLGDLATWFSPESSRELGTALCDALKHTAITDRGVIERRKQHAARFTWKQAALSTRNLYKSVL